MAFICGLQLYLIYPQLFINRTFELVTMFDQVKTLAATQINLLDTTLQPLRAAAFNSEMKEETTVRPVSVSTLKTMKYCFVGMQNTETFALHAKLFVRNVKQVSLLGCVILLPQRMHWQNLQLIIFQPTYFYC